MDMNHLAIEIQEWADAVFPQRTDHSMFLKLYREIGELIDADDPEQIESELADLFILLLDYARRKNLNPSIAVQRKMRVNRTRQWTESAMGVFQHVPGT